MILSSRLSELTQL